MIGQIEDHRGVEQQTVLGSSSLINQTRVLDDLDAQLGSLTVVVAEPQGVQAAIERAQRFRDAGADVLFVEAPRTPDDVARVAQEAMRSTLATLRETGSTDGAVLEPIGDFLDGIGLPEFRTAEQRFRS